MLNLGEEDLKKIWTNLEHSISHYAHALLRDRHLDQLIMCAIYVICKVTNQNREFRTIMHHYRDLPQSASYVYRKVLIRVKGIFCIATFLSWNIKFWCFQMTEQRTGEIS
jgi:hypothetical protein